MGHSTSSGRTQTAPEPMRTPMNRASFRGMIDRVQGRALTSGDSDLFGDALDGAEIGDVVTVMENNRYYRITDTYTRTEGGWRYQRVNNTTGETYEDRTVSSREVAGEVLSTSHVREGRMFWSFYKKR